jgi:hypothetical protein
MSEIERKYPINGTDHTLKFLCIGFDEGDGRLAGQRTIWLSIRNSDGDDFSFRDKDFCIKKYDHGTIFPPASNCFEYRKGDDITQKLIKICRPMILRLTEYGDAIRSDRPARADLCQALAMNLNAAFKQMIERKEWAP